MISARVGPPGEFLLLAPVRGLTTEGANVVAAMEAFGPCVLGIGLSPEELQGLLTYFVTSEAEPVVPLTPNETGEVRGLVRFGEVRVPNPSFVDALRFASERGLPIQPLDPHDEDSAALFAEHIGYFELVRRTVREHRVARTPPAPSTPDEFAIAWDEEVGSGRGSREFARARDRHLALAAHRLTEAEGQVAVLVDRERFESVRSLLAQPTPSAIVDD